MASSSRHLPGWLVPALLAAPCLPLSAQPELVADLSISVQPSAPPTPAPGAVGILTVTVSNHGPDDAGLTSFNDHPLMAYTNLQEERPDGGIDVYFFPAYPADSCVMFAVVVDPMPGGRPQWAHALYFEPILAGESTTCSLRYQVDENVADQEVPITWRVRTFTETDPNPDNDTVEIVFNVAGQVPQPATPVPVLKPVGFGVLLLTVLVMGTAANRRRAQGGGAVPAQRRR